MNPGLPPGATFRRPGEGGLDSFGAAGDAGDAAAEVLVAGAGLDEGDEILLRPLRSDEEDRESEGPKDVEGTGGTDSKQEQAGTAAEQAG